jgi:uroporphyrin-III C-methyltransferase/precorrin-2 dehydrogenase/sirohydrochlorin ferrochelatase
MLHLPVFAALEDRDCLVVGGGAVAERRVRMLLDARARVTVLAPALTDALERLAASEALIAKRERFNDQPLEPYWFVVAASDDEAVNARVAAAAAALKRWCNVVDDPARCSAIMPAIIDREPVTIAISSGGHAPVLARWLKSLIETSLPSRIGALARLAGAWRRRVAQALPGLDERRRFWQTAFDGHVAALSFAGRDEAAGRALGDALAGSSANAGRRVPGEAYLVGAGPGNRDLLTLRGRQLLADADVVLYDRLVGAEILDFARREAELICVAKTPGRPSITQEQISRLLVQKVAAGHRVCRLKGGDPMIFGRGGEEVEALVAAGLPFQIVPGVSAVEGCAAYAGVPLTLRGESRAVLITTGHAEGRLAPDLSSFKPGQTLALYMAVSRLPQLGLELMRLGHAPATSVAIIERGTTDAQRVISTRLADLADAHAELEIESPSLIVVGPTSRHAERYAWFAPGRVEVFQPKDAADRLAHVS